MYEGHVAVPIFSMPSKIIDVLGGIILCMGFLLGHVTDCYRIFCYGCAIMPKKRVSAKEQNLSRRVFQILLSLRRAVWLVSYYLCLFCFQLAEIEG